MNSLLPAGYDVFWALCALLWIVALVFTVLALVSLARTPPTGQAAVLWTLFVLFIPVIGATVWLFAPFGRRSARGPDPAGAEE